jgi:hypothetical protein
MSPISRTPDHFFLGPLCNDGRSKLEDSGSSYRTCPSDPFLEDVIIGIVIAENAYMDGSDGVGSGAWAVTAVE